VIRAALVTWLVVLAVIAKCPWTGWALPLDVRANLAARKILLDEGSLDPIAQDTQREMCRQSPIWWLTHFAWTYVIKEVGADGIERPAKVSHRPFVPWPCQVDAMHAIVEAIRGGRDVVGPKSRDMGYSWLVAAIADWHFLFVPDSHSMLTSRIEPLVDRMGDPDCLFWKVDYLNANQPSWLLPGPIEDYQRGGDHRSHLTLKNPKNGSTIVGAATTPHIGRAGRRTFIAPDEFAHVGGMAEAAWSAASDATACRIAFSSPGEPGTYFDELWTKAIEGEDGAPVLVKLTYDQHPQKAAGGEWRVDEDGRITRRKGARYFWSPWFELQVKKRDWLDLATNVLCMQGIGGTGFFDAVAVYAMIDRWQKPARRCELVADSGGTVRLETMPEGRWYVYEEPDPRSRFLIFVDPSWGVGAANACAAVLDAKTGRFVAEFVDPTTPPLPLAEQVALGARTVFKGEESEALAGFEVNGPGGEFDGHLNRAGHRRIWREHTEGEVTDRATRRLGWLSNREKKRAVLGAFNRAIIKQDCAIRSKTTLLEALRYTVCEDGSIDIASRYDMETGAREGHGDRVVAHAGAWLMLGSGGAQPDHAEPPTEWPEGSIGAKLGIPREDA